MLPNNHVVPDQVVDETKLVHLVVKMVARPSNQFTLEARTQMAAAIFLQKQERYRQLISNLPFLAIINGPLQSIILANGRYDEQWRKWKQQRKVLKEMKIIFENILIPKTFNLKVQCVIIILNLKVTFTSSASGRSPTEGLSQQIVDNGKLSPDGKTFTYSWTGNGDEFGFHIQILTKQNFLWIVTK